MAAFHTTSISRLIVACAACALLSTPALAQHFGGRWDTNQGVLRIDQDAYHVRGDYDFKGGRIVGEVEDNTLSGIWAQNYSDRRCFEERLGSHFWGRYRLHLAHDDEEFHGHWSYCDEGPRSGGDWDGKRLHREPWEHHREHW
ncbi:MAG: hypothetical protein P4L57_00045 [Rhizomicrobium sp.]|nr:hypothetical protein [Rhizomicrobium sp.]